MASTAAILSSIIPDMGRPKRTLPPVHRTLGPNPRWYFRAQIDVQTEPGVFERRTQPYYLDLIKDLPSKKKAEAKRDEICARLNNRVEIIQAQTAFGVILDAFLTTYLPALKPNTGASYRTQIENYIRPAFGETRLCDLTPLAVQRWVNALELSPGSKQIAVTVLRSVYERAAEWGYTQSRNPAARVIIPPGLAPQQRRAFTPEEYLRIRARLRAPLDTAADVAAFCGLRVGEIAALTRGALDYAAGTISIAQNMAVSGEISTPKKGRARTVAMGWLRADLLRLAPRSAPPARSVFGLGYQQFTSTLDRALDAAGVVFPGAGWHCFRRMYATYGRRFLEMADVQATMGHSRPSMTEHYIDEDQERRASAMERMRALIFFAGEGGRA